MDVSPLVGLEGSRLPGHAGKLKGYALCHPIEKLETVSEALLSLVYCGCQRGNV
jgi:hypothetical protein